MPLLRPSHTDVGRVPGPHCRIGANWSPPDRLKNSAKMRWTVKILRIKGNVRRACSGFAVLTSTNQRSRSSAPSQTVLLHQFLAPLQDYRCMLRISSLSQA
jgi:hypothetical protein